MKFDYVEMYVDAPRIGCGFRSFAVMEKRGDKVRVLELAKLTVAWLPARMVHDNRTRTTLDTRGLATSIKKARAMWNKCGVGWAKAATKEVLEDLRRKPKETEIVAPKKTAAKAAPKKTAAKKAAPKKATAKRAAPKKEKPFAQKKIRGIARRSPFRPGTRLDKCYGHLKAGDTAETFREKVVGAGLVKERWRAFDILHKMVAREACRVV